MKITTIMIVVTHTNEISFYLLLSEEA